MKTKTDAYKKVEALREARHKGWQKITAKDLSCAVYVKTCERTGRYLATGYRGKALKPAFSYYYTSEQSRAARVSEWISATMETRERYQRKARALVVGDVLRSSWGYDQTNIDYYVVLETFGAFGVVIAECGKNSEDTGCMQGKCVPDPSRIVGAPMRKQCDGDSVKINSFIYASKIEPQMIAGAKVYGADRWTAYH